MSISEMQIKVSQDGSVKRASGRPGSLDQKDLKERQTYMRKISARGKGSSIKSGSKENLLKKLKNISARNLTKAIDRHIQQKYSPASMYQVDSQELGKPESVTKVNLKIEAGPATGSICNISDIIFSISDVDVLPKSSSRNLKTKVLNLIFPKTDDMSSSEFEEVVKNLYRCCLKSVTDLHELHLRRVRALGIIKKIIQKANSEYITIPHIIHIIWSIMSCLHHFQLRLKGGSNRLVMYNRQRQLDKCMEYYYLLIRMFKTSVHRVILSAIITFYKDGKLWDIEFACTDMISALLEVSEDVELGVNDLFDSAVYSVSGNVLEGQKLMEVIYEVLRTLKWNTISKKLIDRLIFMLEASISPFNFNQHVYGPLRMGLDLCVRHIINNMANKHVMVILKRLLKKMVKTECEETILNFGNLASYAAKSYKMKSLYGNVTPDLLSTISLLIRNQDEVTFLTTARIWLNLIDRNKNSVIVNQPRIFFWDCDYKIKIKRKRNPRDVMFFKIHRNFFYELILDCFKQCGSRGQMNTIFEMCAVALIEIPCGYTAATFTSVAMSMQEYAQQITNENLVKSHGLHATALSIMTLICYIHKAEILYDYIINIIQLRAEWAPHLIPPLKSKYEYAVHHVLWNKGELFFEDWETSYGLWKCFRDKNKSETQ